MTLSMRTSITVHAEDVRLCYIVDMENDLIETITFFTDTAAEPTCVGELRFTYLQDLPAVEDPLFATSPDVRGAASRQTDRPQTLPLFGQQPEPALRPVCD